MTPATLEDHQSRLLGALTIATVKRLGGDTVCVDQDNRFRSWRMARIDDVVLIDQPADETGLRSINCYRVELEEIDPISQLAEHGKKFKVDPDRLLYALQWQTFDEPPEFNSALVRDPVLWFDEVATMLLGALNHHDPHLLDAARARLN